MPRTRNITRQQWQAATLSAGDANASAIRALGPRWRRFKTSHSSFDDVNTNTGSSLKENRGYDQESGDDREQNVDDNSQEKGKKHVQEGILTGEKRKLQPLQDITDLMASHSDRFSGADERRMKGRHRVGIIASTYLVSPNPVHNPIAQISFPSSLPPSSPPSPASFDLPTSKARQDLEIWEDVASVEQEELPLASDDPEPARNSDPFGFFAVEKELKAQRDQGSRQNPYTEIREAEGLVLVPASSLAPFQPDITAILNDSEREFVSPCATPKTPHKRKQRSTANKGKGKEKENLLLSPRTESLPSSPSPLKTRETRTIFQNRSSSYVAICSDGNIDRDIGAIENLPHRVLRSRAKAQRPVPHQRKARAKRGRVNRNNTPSDPAEPTRILLDRLPKRRKRHVPGETEPCQEKRQRKSHKAASKCERPAAIEVCALKIK